MCLQVERSAQDLSPATSSNSSLMKIGRRRKHPVAPHSALHESGFAIP